MTSSRTRAHGAVFLTVLSVLAAACGEDTLEDQKTSLEPSTPSALDGGTTGRGKLDASQLPPVQRADASILAREGAPTWHQDIAPLVSEKCSACHEEGGIAPFSLKSYASARDFADLMATAVENGSMPPFLAQETESCKPPFPWVADLRLNDAEKKLLRDWADNGAPEGNASKAKPLVPPLSVQIEREDAVVSLPKPFTIEGTKDRHACVVIDPKLAADSYVISRQITSGNPQVLHHVVSYLISPGMADDPVLGPLWQHARSKSELEALIKQQKGVGIGESYDCFGGPGLEAPLELEILDAWAPGGVPNKAPPDSGQPISKDALVMLDIHYHPTGGKAEIDDSTKLSLMLAASKPKYISKTVLIGNFEKPVTYSVGQGDLLKQPNESVAEFVIPPNVKDHIEENTWKWTLPAGLKVYGVGTHMHYVGRGMRITIDHVAPAAGKAASECLIETPSWDFNWQRGYAFDAPTYEALPDLSNGDLMHFRCSYDNTMGNRFVARELESQGKTAPVEVRLGEDTLDEMCLGALGIMYPNP